MIIHIVRHAEAVDRSENISEEHRFLTPRGRKRFREAAKALRKTGAAPDLILTSPLLRAVQTADILAESLRYEGDMLVEQLLSPGFRPQKLDRLLNVYPHVKELVLVGHEPDVGMVVGSLLGSEGSCSLTKGAIVSFQTTGPGQADFVGMITGGGKTITSKSKAQDKLQGKQQ
ncbi:phosphoglycerate mutase family protein [Geomonas sp.]|uniref:SixA phosphatase family protein n=1 Tax=Geomonas sp. TaxID=2651584 RepID=UPI002B49D526|nr:phosphoglycerate mutase family protein [Geomonas sp.]HJV36155.1 phosphoglycerate mutase family protein [Geomonas sp.]